MLAYLLVYYDVRLEPGAPLPSPGVWFSKGRMPDPTVNLQFRARENPNVPWNDLEME